MQEELLQLDYDPPRPHLTIQHIQDATLEYSQLLGK